MTLSKPLTIKLIFVVHALLAGAFLTRIADIQVTLGLSDGELGLVLVAQPLGLLTMFAFSSRVIEVLGSRIALTGSIASLCVFTFLLGVMPSRETLFAGLFVYALFFAVLHVTMNVEADRVESSLGVKVMSECHGYWAFGYLATTMVGVFMRGWGVPVSVHLGGLCLFALVAGLALMSQFDASRPRAHTAAAGKRPVFVLPSGTILLLVVFGASGALAEMSARAWSVIYMRDSFAVSDWIETVSLPVFAVAVAASRLFADKFLDRVGTVTGARILLGTAMAGVALVALAPHPYLALAGFALMGVGVCISVPLMLSCAARIGDRPASENVAAATLSNSLTMLAAPAAMGLASEAFGIQAAFGLLIPCLLISFGVAGILVLRDAADADKAPDA